VDLAERDLDADTPERIVHRAGAVAYLGTTDPSRDALVAASPAILADENTPPSFIWATAGDILVPARHSMKFAERLADVGVPYDLHVYEQGHHGLSLATQASARSRDDVDPRAADWIHQAAAWLESRFALDIA